MSEVAVAVERHTKGALVTALSKLSDPLQISGEIERVIIKPSIYNPDYPGNTDIELVEGLVKMFQSTAPVYVVESDNPVRTTEEAFAKCGYNRLLDHGAELVNLSHQPLHTVKMNGHYFREHNMPKILDGNILLVNAATIKRESDARVMGASIKNLFGLLPEVDKSVYHDNIHSVLIDLLIAYRPKITILDLTQMVSGLRKEKLTTRTNGVVVGYDPVAIDSFGARLIDIEPLDVPHLVTAHTLGLGEIMSEKIRVLGTEYQKQLIEIIQN